MTSLTLTYQLKNHRGWGKKMFLLDGLIEQREYHQYQHKNQDFGSGDYLGDRMEHKHSCTPNPILLQKWGSLKK
jgi:hypothetical protein